MNIRRTFGCCGVLLLWAVTLFGAPTSDLADAVMQGNKEAVHSLLDKKVNVNAPQTDGTTALHWAVREDDLGTVDLLLHAGAKASARNHDGVTPMLLATVNGNAVIINRLIQAGVDPNAPVTQFGDTPLMLAARTGKIDAIKLLLDHGAQVNAKETWGGTTALMWAVFQHHPDAAKMLIGRGADVNVRSLFIPANTSRGAIVSPPVESKPGQPAQEFSTGLMSALLIAAREGDLDCARILLAAGADANATDGDGKDSLGLAIYNGNYDLASFLIDSHAQVNHTDAQGFTPLFWAVDRRNMETAPNFPWIVTTDAMPLIQKLLDAGADPNAVINNTPRAHMREGSPRIVFATAIMRAAFSGDIDVFKLLLDHGADTNILSSDNENTIEAAAGEGFINGYHRARPPADRLEVIKLLVQRGGVGSDVNWADNYGITPLMVAANLGDLSIIQYLVDAGADLGAHDLGKKYDGQFGASVEPLMPIDYAIGVGTFVPNNAAIMHEDAVKLMARLMQEKGIKHTTSECSLRGFTCSIAKVDPKTATPAEIKRMRKVQTGYQVDGLTGGLANKDQDQDKDKK